MILTGHRRIVTGLDSMGRSAVIIDGPSDELAWSTSETPADNSGSADRGGAFSFSAVKGGSCFTALELPPGHGRDDPGMHASDTIDYLVVVKGEVTLVTETGEVSCGVGDMIVDRGVLHGWRNLGTETALLVAVLIDAAPVGNGATVA